MSADASAQQQGVLRTAAAEPQITCDVLVTFQAADDVSWELEW